MSMAGRMAKRANTRSRAKRGDRFLKERVHDPYRDPLKPRGPSSCPRCGAQYRNGRWVWSNAEAYAPKTRLCPACHRIDDDYPAGEIILSGKFLDNHRDEILARVRHVEESEHAEHPLHRIISIDERANKVVIHTTDVHLPHRIAHALTDAWGGAMNTHYDPEGYFVRVRWERRE
jgi:NMD protein affecting ribosome stability and mRNA decay